MNRDDLTSKQNAVVQSTARTLLVKGGAGSGKTTVALWAARTELERAGNEAKRALFLTFSRTAVDQIQSRSTSAVGPVGSRIEVHTFHSFAYRLVRRFGHVAGLTTPNPTMQSASEAKLIGKVDGRLIYDDLAPLACGVLDDPRVGSLIASRWCLVACDEFQDTGDSQWSILERVSQHARLLLLGDENQLIYGFLASTGVVPERMACAEAWVEETIELEAASHRDPSGAIPALASAVRQRRFDDPAIADALENGRMFVTTGVAGEIVVDAIRDALDAAWARGCRTFGVFAHSNESVAALSARLHEAGIDHYLVGLPDAEADALGGMLAITRFAFGEADWSDVQAALGSYLTACSRGKRVPALAQALVSGSGLPDTPRLRLESLRADAADASDCSILEVSEVAAEAWGRLGITGADSPWQRSAPSFVAVARQAGRESDAPLSYLARSIGELRSGAMFDSRRRRLPAVQLMNLHQTKGREVDGIVVVSDDDDFHGFEDEPFVEGSRLLYVILTRARREVTMIFGHNPHPLVAPIAALV